MLDRDVRINGNFLFTLSYFLFQKPIELDECESKMKYDNSIDEDRVRNMIGVRHDRVTWSATT